jgi:hypothetical protein
MNLKEYKVIASSVRLDEIPARYRKLRFLGRGATTLAFLKDEHTVLLFTRDNIKVEWLRDGLRMMSNYQPVNPVRAHHIRGMSDMPLMMVEMPRLYQLDAANRKKVVQEIKLFTKLAREENLSSKKDWSTSINRMIERYEEENPHSEVLPLLQWLMNYEADQITLDMGARQFKQTADGRLVLLDPIVSQELFDIILQHLRRT